jgi:hypothetical protein
MLPVYVNITSAPVSAPVMITAASDTTGVHTARANVAAATIFFMDSP